MENSFGMENTLAVLDTWPSANCEWADKYLFILQRATLVVLIIVNDLNL